MAAILGIHLLLASAAAAGAEDAPAARSFGIPEVQQAWDEDQEDGVKDWMRAMLKRSKKAKLRIPSTGKKPKCGSCHDNLKRYPLAPNAMPDLLGLLEQLNPGRPEDSD
jgi:hypothetical protein